ncbi:formate hydrogenlyase subunit 3/multisubunit Na+/H+ antiporter MnhD subunit [Lysobacter sp. OAE881]
MGGAVNAWIAAALATPCLLLLACVSLRLRSRMPALLAFAPLPALLAGLLASYDVPLRIGSARFALVFALDVPGAMLLGAAALLWIVAGVHARGHLVGRPDAGAFVVAWLMTLTGCVGVFLAADVVGFYFLLALLSVGAAGLVLQGQGAQALRAGAIYLGVALFAEAFLLAGLILAVQASPSGSLLIADVAATLASSQSSDLALTLLVVGLGIKAGLVPFHFWMPLAYGAAPVPAAAVLSGAVVKASLLAMVRLLPFDTALPEFGLPLACVGMFGALYGVAVGITRSNAKLVLAYSSVSQMGFVMAIVGMGLATGNAATPLVAAFYAVHHLLVKGALFLCVDAVPATRARAVLVPAGVIALGLAGLPLAGGFVAKYAAKDVFGEGAFATLAVASSVATAWLMCHLLRRLAVDANLSARFSWTWFAMAFACVFVPWWIYVATPIGTASALLAASVLRSSLWPVLAGGALALATVRTGIRWPAVPAGDVGAMLRGLERLAGRIATAFQQGDIVVRRWHVASVALLLIAAAFYWTLRAP